MTLALGLKLPDVAGCKWAADASDGCTCTCDALWRLRGEYCGRRVCLSPTRCTSFPGKPSLPALPDPSDYTVLSRPAGEYSLQDPAQQPRGGSRTGSPALSLPCMHAPLLSFQVLPLLQDHLWQQCTPLGRVCRHHLLNNLHPQRPESTALPQESRRRSCKRHSPPHPAT